MKTASWLVQFGSSIQILERKISKINLTKWANIFFAVVLCSKFYYLWGTVNYLSPSAPFYIILLRDVAVFGFLTFFGFVGRSYFKELKWFWVLWLIGFGISLFQLSMSKDLATWAQHYFRNVLAVMLFFPVLFGLFRAGIRISIVKTLSWIFWINLIASYAQVFLNDSLKRPSGIFGDAILGTLILLLGLVAVFFQNQNFVRILAFIFAIPLVYLMSSVSSLLSFTIGISGVFILGWRFWSAQFFRFLTFGIILFAVGVVLVFGTGRMVRNGSSGFEGISAKIIYLYEAVFCVGPCWQNWSYRGRVVSNQRPFEFCENNLKGCVLGHFESAEYERLESTFGSLWVNWGGVFCLFYLAWVLSYLTGLRRMIRSDSSKEVWLWLCIILSGMAFMIFNTLTYRFPFNILLYGAFAYAAFLFKNKSKKVPS